MTGGHKVQIQLNANTKILTQVQTEPVMKAIADLKRDITKSCSDAKSPGAAIVLEHGAQLPGCFSLEANPAQAGKLTLCASDDLGFIYGIYHISREILGIQDFWFWNDQMLEKQDAYPVGDDYVYNSMPFAVKLRGWFVNDEVLLHTWSLEGNKDEPWQMVFETLLRCGGNMIIPGTDRNSAYYRSLASKRGLNISHHHAEPLGAEMFSRAYLLRSA